MKKLTALLDRFGTAARSRLPGRKHASNHRASGHARFRAPRLEVLEQRRLLAVFTVNHFADTVDVARGDGSALDASGNTTLRAAIMEANALSGDDTINLPAGTYVLTIAGTGEDAATTGDLDVTDTTGSLTLLGAGDATTIIDANSLDRVFQVLGAVTLELSGVTITNGSVYNGGGVYNEVGTVTVTNSTLSENSADGNGGGIYNLSGNVTVSNSTFFANSAQKPSGGGGGILNHLDATLTITDSSFSDNSVAGYGGGVWNKGVLDVTAGIFDGNAAVVDGGGIWTDGTATIVGSTLSGNSANYGAGILKYSGTLDISGSTLSDNVAALYGGGIFNYIDGATLTNSSLSGNSAGTYGGGIFVDPLGTITIDNTTLSGNSAGYAGGGILNYSSALEITDSVFSGNQADSYGGGLSNSSSATATLINSTLWGNSAGVSGGGVYNIGTLALTNGTLSENSAVDYGGGILNDGTLTLTNSTLSGNSADSGGGIRNHLGTVNAKNTIVAGNTATTGDPDVLGDFSSQGNNLIGDAATSTGWLPSDLVGTSGSPIDPLLGPLQDNGGLTSTHALLFGSPAIDAGDNTGVSATDQRGYSRLVDGDGDGTPTVDIGAFEEQRRLLAVFTVNDFADTVDANPGDGFAADASGNTTLRAAIMEANALGGDDTINVPAGTFALSIAGTGEDAAATGDLDVTDTTGSLTIQGAGAGQTIIDANQIDRVFQTFAGVTLDIEDVTITGGSVTGLNGRGGGIYNTDGTVTLTDSVVDGNLADHGGGIWSSGNGATMTLTNSTVSNNTASGNAGGVDNNNAGTLTITNSTLSANTGNVGGAIFNYGTVQITNSTLSGNSADQGGGIVSAGGGILGRTTTVQNTIIAGNSASRSDPDVLGSFTSQGNNLIGDVGDASGFTDGVNGDQVGGGGNPVIDPLLGPLQDNGGPTFTHALLFGSPAIDAGDNTGVSATDQRGYSRLADGDGDGTPTVDIGAFELEFAQIDFGDAPGPYPTTLAEDGARHLATGPTLGTSRDTEPNGQPTANADGDDITGTLDDEDGVTLPVLSVSTTAATTASLDIDLQNADAVANYLDAWIDFNQDGDWDDSGEQVFTSYNLGTTDGDQSLTFTVPQDTGGNIAYGTTYARFRLSTAGGLLPTGLAGNGEVEDYPVAVTWFGPAQALNTNADSDSGGDWYPQVTTDGAGNWVAVWSSSDTLGWTISFDVDILVSRSADAGGTWTAPVPLNTNAGSDSGSDYEPQVTTDGAGNWVAVWQSNDSLGETVGTDHDILVSRSTDAGGTWTAPAPLNSNAGSDSGDDWAPQVTTDGAGNWVAVWHSEDSLGGSIGTDRDILVSRSTNAGGTWTAPAPLNTSAASDSGGNWTPQVTTDGAGNWVAVWTSGDSLGGTIGTDGDIFVSRSADAGGTWTTQAPLNSNAGSDSGDDFYTQVTTDGAGNWVAVWSSNDSLRRTIGFDRDILVSRSTDAGGTWTASAPLNSNAGSDSGYDSYPQVTTDGAGNWVAVWDSYDSLGGTIGTDRDILVSRSTDAGGTWTDLAPLNTYAGSDSGYNWAPQVTTDGAGNWVAVWYGPSYDSPGGTIGTDHDILFATFSEILNLPPVLDSIGNKSIDEQTELTFTAMATDPDVPANTLSFSLDAGAPAGASIHPVSGAFSWTPTEAQGPGSYPITVRVTDDGTPVLDHFEIITISVNEVNRSPVLDSIGNKSIDEQTELTFTATATDPDFPSNTLTFSLDAGAPAGASIDPATGLFTWRPTEAQGPGSYPFAVRVTDDGTPARDDSETITVMLSEVNLPPVLDSIGNKSVDELTELTFTATATDPDVPANTLTFSLDAGAPAGASIDPATGLFTWRPTEAQGPGSYPFAVRVTDDGTPARDDSETITVMLGEVNLPPVLDSIGNKSIDEQTELTFTATATDPDFPSNTLTFSLDAGAPAGASIDPATGLFTWRPTEAQGPGSYPFAVRVTDDGTPARDDSETITVMLSEVNLPPVLDSIGNKSIDEQTELTFTATAIDPDLPANTLTFSLDAGAPAGASIDPATGLFTWRPTEAQGPGSYPITVRVTDDGTGNFWDSESITVTVNDHVTNLGTLGLVQRSGLDPSAGDLWFRVETISAGILTAEAFFQGDGDSVQLAIYDANQTDPPLATSALVDGSQRVDLAGVSAGEAFFVKVSGSHTNVDLRVANLIDHRGTTLIVHGTDGDDTFEFNAAESRLITINGVEYVFDDAEVNFVTFDGQAGYDIVTLRDSPGDETLTAEPGSVTFVENTGLFTVQATAFEELQAYARAGGADKAVLKDSAGYDKFKGDPTVSKLYKGGVFYHRVKFFDSVECLSSGGDDFARLWDSPANDTLQTQRDLTRLYGEGFDITVGGFNRVYTRATGGGHDTAHITDSPEDDTTRARAHKVMMWGGEYADPTYKLTARTFDEVLLYATQGGFDKAKLHDTIRDDVLEATEDWVKLSTQKDELETLYQAFAFEWAKAYATEGRDTVIQSAALPYDLIFDGNWIE